MVYFCKWFAFFIIGVLVGLTAFVMAFCEEKLVDWRDEIVEKLLEKDENNQGVTWAFLSFWCFGLAAIGSALTIYIGPGAAGSGIAEIIAVLNGVNYPGFIGYGTLFCKIVCVILGIAASLCIGKEGPLAHIGSIWGQIVIHNIPIPQFDYFKNDVSKREFLAGGVSAGVSAAFGSPIGGSLFSYELSKPTTFWTFNMLWRVFFCSSVSTYTLSLAKQIQAGDSFSELHISAGQTLKFGSLYDNNMRLMDIHAPIILGLAGGSLGALFITVNTFMGRQRKKIIGTSNFRRVIETGFFAMLTMTVSLLFIVVYRNHCVEIKVVDGDSSVYN